MKLQLPGTRWAVLLALLAATTAAALLKPPEGEPVVQPTAAGIQAAGDGRRSEAGRTGMAALQLDRLKRKAVLKQENATDLFLAKSWVVPPPPLPPSPPILPAPPPLPFSYMGRVVEDGKSIIFLSRQEQNFAVKEGDIVEGQYRVEKIQPQAMILTYLPLNMQQTLAMGGLN